MPPVACKVHAGMAVLAARGAAVSRCGGVSCRFLFSPVPFSDGLVGDRLFTFLQLLMEEVAAAAAVCCNVFTALGVDFQGFHISFAHVLVPTKSFANGTFSIEDVLRYSAILHAAHIANSAHSALPE